MSAHSWAKTLEIERRAEAILDGVFGPEFLIVRATRAHQRYGVDRFFIKRNAVTVYVVDYKVDQRASETGNLAIEHVSVRRGGQVQARGWIHTTSAELIVSYVPDRDVAYVLDVAKIRSLWDDILRLFPAKSAFTPPAGPGEVGSRSGYETLNCCVPIAWLRESGMIRREVRAVGVQLRLRLRVPRLPD